MRRGRTRGVLIEFVSWPTRYALLSTGETPPGLPALPGHSDR